MIHQYFRDYATHFSLWPYIRFNTRVDRLYRPEGGEESGQWVIESWTSNPDLGGKKREEFDFVCVGNGHYQDGWIPDIPGLRYVHLSKFIIHSAFPL
jgi:cation diffusion facilitator CzcD-associated flavoprotein CzcO